MSFSARRVIFIGSIRIQGRRLRTSLESRRSPNVKVWASGASMVTVAPSVRGSPSTTTRPTIPLPCAIRWWHFTLEPDPRSRSGQASHRVKQGFGMLFGNRQQFQSSVARSPAASLPRLNSRRTDVQGPGQHSLRKIEPLSKPNDVSL